METDFQTKIKILNDQISVQEGPYDFERHTTFPVSNELNFHDTVEYLDKQHKDAFSVESLPPGTKRVAVLVGESNFPSMLPELARFADTVIFVDINPRLLEAHLYQVECIRHAITASECFFTRYCDKTKNPLLTSPTRINSYSRYNDGKVETFKDPLLTANSLEMFTVQYLTKVFKTVDPAEKEKKVSSYTYLEPEARFRECQAAAKKLTFCSLRMDLFKLEQAKQLKAILDSSNAVVTVFNTSNLFYLDSESPFNPKKIDPLWAPRKNLTDSMRTLIQPEKTLILFSTYFEKNSERLRSQHAIGFVNYVGANMRAINTQKGDAKMAARPSPVLAPPQKIPAASQIAAKKPEAFASGFLTPKKK